MAGRFKLCISLMNPVFTSQLYCAMNLKLAKLSIQTAVSYAADDYERH